MKKKILGFIVGFLLIGVNLHAADGDLIVNNKLGVGNTSPTYQLDVTGDVRFTGDMRFTGTLQGGSVPWARLTTFPSACASGQFVRGVGTTLTCATPAGSGVSGSGTANYISKWTGGTSLGNSQVYDNGTNVGIGTTSPNYKLDQPFGFFRTSFNTTTVPPSDNTWGGLIVGWNRSGWKAEVNFYGAYENSTAAFQFSRKTGASTYNDLVTFMGNGNVGIGITDPGTYKLYVSGSAYATSGWFSSDKKFKKDIAPIESALSKVLQINGVSFNWDTKGYEEKGFSEGRHYGVIAQEIEKVLPEVVKTVRFKPKGKEEIEIVPEEEKIEEKAVAYNELIPILIEAIKEQQKEIDGLKAEMADLRNSN